MEKKSKGSIYIIVIIAVIAVSIMYSYFKKNNYLHQNFDFTVARTINYINAGDIYKDIEYIYFVNNLKYTGYIKEDYDLKSPLKKYYKVKYSKIKPEISEIYLLEEITDCSEIVRAGFN